MSRVDSITQLEKQTGHQSILLFREPLEVYVTLTVPKISDFISLVCRILGILYSTERIFIDGRFTFIYFCTLTGLYKRRIRLTTAQLNLNTVGNK